MSGLPNIRNGVIYEDRVSIDENILSFSRGENFYLFDIESNKFIGVDYTAKTSFVNGIAKVYKGEKVNRIDKRGDIQLDDWLNDTWIKTGNISGKKSIVDKNGRILVMNNDVHHGPFKYNILDNKKLLFEKWLDKIELFDNGYYSYNDGFKVKLIKSDGKLIYEGRLGDPYKKVSGILGFNLVNNYFSISKIDFTSTGGKTGVGLSNLLTLDGELVFNKRYSSINLNNRNLIVVKERKSEIETISYVVDLTGKMLRSPIQGYHYSEVSENYSILMRDHSELNRHDSIINKYNSGEFKDKLYSSKGEELFEGDLGSITFRDGDIVHLIDKNDIHFLHKDGKLIGGGGFDFVGEIRNGLISVKAIQKRGVLGIFKQRNNGWSIIDSSGVTILDEIFYNNLGPVSDNGYFLVENKMDGGSVANWMNLEGEKVFNEDIVCKSVAECRGKNAYKLIQYNVDGKQAYQIFNNSFINIFES